MFKKNIAVSQTRPLSGKDGKKLRRDIEKLYPSLTEDDHSRLFASKSDINLLKLSNKATAYAPSGGNPLFFDPTGREDVLIPTVYALWLCPRMLPSLYTYSEVSPKVCKQPHPGPPVTSHINIGHHDSAAMSPRCLGEQTCFCKASLYPTLAWAHFLLGI